MKAKLTRRILALLLTLAMTLSMLPGVFAAETNPFTDVKETDWFYDSVMYCRTNNLMAGTGDKLFSPTVLLSRAMLVTILYRLNNSPEITYTAKFPDVPDGKWYSAAVIWASENGIVAGYPNGNFGTNDNVTREQAAAFLYRYADHIGEDMSAREDLTVFPDYGSISSYTLTSLQWAVAKGVINGKATQGKTLLDPKGFATRAEIAALMKGFVEKVILAPKKSSDIVVLYTNDVHCNINPVIKDDVVTNMGYTNVAALKRELLQDHDFVTLVDAGDAIQGGPVGTLSKGEYLIDIMNQVGYDYATFGNHEFDYGMDQLLNTLVPKARFKYLSCNFGKLDGKAFEYIKGYTLQDYAMPSKSTRVAYIGITTPESFTKSTPTYFQDGEGNYIYTFCEGGNGADLYTQVQATINTVKAAGADYVIAIAHLGTDEASTPWRSTDVIANTSGIDVVLDGHSHSTIASQTVKDKGGNDVLLSSAGTKLSSIGKLTITAEGKLTTELITGYTKSFALTDTTIANIESQYNELLKEKVATSTVDLTVNSPDGVVRAVRSRETNLGDLCADAYRLTLGADIGFVNGGGIRSSIPAGDITYEQVITVHPFGNMACVVEATGQQIIDALEMSSRAVTAEDRVTGTDGKVNASGELGGFLQVSGLKYTIDTSVASTVKLDDKQSFVSVDGARRVKDVQVLQADGSYAPIVLTKTYKLASHNYMLKSGGDGLNMFMGNKVLQDEVMIDNQVLITYIESMGGTVGAEYANLAGQGRITVTDSVVVEGYEITDFSKYGNTTINLKCADIFTLGYAYGDIIKVLLPTGVTLELPFVKSYSDVDSGSPAILAREDDEFVSLAINMGDFAGTYGLATKIKDDSTAGYHWDWIVAPGSVVQLSLGEKEGYLSEYLLHQLSRTNNREDYAEGNTLGYPVLTDAEFANFRAISTTGMGRDVLYRSSSPINPEIGRNTYADAALGAAGIQTVINLADSKETMEAYPGYTETNYALCNIMPLNMGVDFQAEDFELKLANGLRYIAQQPGPYMVHCTEGKDRAGFVSALLEAYMGADYNEIITDYMTTYYNYYGVVFGTEQAIAISQSNIVKSLMTAFDIDDITTADLQAEAVAYFKEIGLNDDELYMLTRHLGGEEGNIVVLFTNDVHCNVTPTNSTLGYANVAALKKEMEAKADFVTLVDAGDAIQGGPIGTLSKGEYLIDIMNYVGYDFATFGNHEFDYGMDQLLNTLVPKAEFKYLSCNFFKLEGSTATKPEGVEGATIVNYGDTKVGYIGITTPEAFTKSTPTYFQDGEGNYIYTFSEGNDGVDLYGIVQTYINALKAQGAEYIIAIAHLGTDSASAPWRSTDVIANTTGLTVVLDGHSHSVIGAEYVTDKEGGRVLLSSTGSKLFSIGKLTINRDTGAIQTYLLPNYHKSDAATAAYIDGIQNQYNDLLKEKVASSTVDLTTMSPDGFVRAVRSRETNLGDLCADAYRITLGADIGFVNGGGIRASIPAGDITYEQVITVHPFGNMACVVEATGQQIIDALEMSSRAVTAEDRITGDDGKVNASGELGGFLQVSGLKYSINTFAASTVQLDDKGSFVSVDGDRRVYDVQVLQADGSYAPIDLEKTYKLASHNYMLKSGGDGLNMFMGNKVLQDEVMIDNQVLITYIESMGGTVGAEYANLAGQGRITVTSFDPTPSFKGTQTDTLAEGDRIAIVLAKDGTALSTVPYYYAVKGYQQLVGTPATVTETEAACTNPFVTFTVHVDENGNYHFAEGGQYLTSGATGNNVSMEDEDSDLAAWILESDGADAFYFKNATAAFNENAEYLEYYTNFTTYSKLATSDPTLYAFKLYKLEEGIDLCEHTYGRLGTPPECTVDGSIVFTCTLCEETKTKTLPKLGHDYVMTENADEYIYTCSRCSDRYTVEKGKTATLTDTLSAGDEIVIYHPASATTLDAATVSGTGLAGMAAAVNEDTLNVVKATTVFTVGGDETGYTLQTADGKYLTSGDTGNALSMTATANDCSKWTLTAVTGGINLKNVGANFNGNYNQALEYYNSKYTTYGIKTDAAYIFQLYKLPAPCTEHVFDEGVVTTAATCLTAGVLTKTCTVCGETATEAIAALGHAWDAGTVTTAATCVAQGVMTYTCTRCNETKTEPITTLAEHNYVDGVCTVCGASQPVALTELSQLTAGSKYVIVYVGTDSAVALGSAALPAPNLNYLAGCAATVTDGKLTAYTAESVYTLVAGSVEGTFQLKAPDGAYLTHPSGPYLRVTETGTDILFSKEAAGFTLLLNDTATAASPRYVAYITGDPKFGAANSNTNDNPVKYLSIFKVG